VRRGETPVLTEEQARRLLDSIRTSTWAPLPLDVPHDKGRYLPEIRRAKAGEIVILNFMRQRILNIIRRVRPCCLPWIEHN
jgi:hypothetical protein